MTLSTISLKHPATLRRIIRRMGENEELRRKVFKEVARVPQLQRDILACFAKHPAHHGNFILKLAKNRRMRRDIFKIAAPKPR